MLKDDRRMYEEEELSRTINTENNNDDDSGVCVRQLFLKWLLTESPERLVRNVFTSFPLLLP